MIKDALKYLEPNAAIPIDMETTIMLVNALKEALAQPEQEPLIGCVNHDCAKCKERTEQEPDYWLGYGLQAHTEKPFENATALYKDPPQRTEQNFCSRCGKRTPDLITIHTCTPPQEGI
jgi:hypothetical protein